MRSLILLLVAIAVVSGLNADILGIRSCVNTLLGQYCSNRDLPLPHDDQLDAAVACNNSKRAADIAGDCAKESSNGLYCGVAHLYLRDVSSAYAACNNGSIGGSECSDECRNGLTALRTELGCCINTIYNGSGSASALFQPLFNDSLWSLCGVETVPTGGCPGGDEYTLPENPQSCTQMEFENKLLSLACTETIRDYLKGVSNCEAYYQYYLELCSVDDKNNFCALRYISDDIATYITPIGQTCNRSTDDCTSDCKSNLQKFVIANDCCVNSLYNSTFGAIGGLNDLFDVGLLDKCDVVNPGTCDAFTTDESGRMLASLGTFVFTLLLVLTLVA